jgi:hypothetical protein
MCVQYNMWCGVSDRRCVCNTNKDEHLLTSGVSVPRVGWILANPGLCVRIGQLSVIVPTRDYASELVNSLCLSQPVSGST